jgi:predicted DNA-binding transcriptional regulator AlpA
MADSDSDTTDDPILSPRRIAADLGIDIVTLWRWRRRGHYPDFIVLGPNRRGQLSSVHRAWKHSRPRVSGGRPTDAAKSAAA